mgnify:CR=1 FL=1
MKVTEHHAQFLKEFSASMEASTPKPEPVCAWCKRPMIQDRAGYYHLETGSVTCSGLPDLPAGKLKVRWPHIERDPAKVAHLRGIITRLETPMMPNTKAAVLSCLDELIRQLKQNHEEKR